MRAYRQAGIERPHAVLEQRRDGRGLGGGKQLLAIRRQRTACEVGHRLVQDGKVLGDFEVVRSHERQPNAVIRNAGLYSLAGAGKPPMLNVACLELTPGGAQNVLARDLGARNDQCHDILQLIAIAVGAARLVKRGARPHPARQGLIQQPTVEKDVHGAIRCLHLHRTQGLVPVVRDRLELRVEVGRPIALDEDQGSRGGGLLAEQKPQLGFFPRPQGDRGLQGAAGIQTCADAIRQAVCVEQRRRFRERSMTADELGAIGGERLLPARHVHERNP